MRALGDVAESPTMTDSDPVLLLFLGNAAEPGARGGLPDDEEAEEQEEGAPPPPTDRGDAVFTTGVADWVVAAAKSTAKPLPDRSSNLSAC